MISSTPHVRCALIFVIVVLFSSCFDNPVQNDTEPPEQTTYLDNQPPLVMVTSPSMNAIVGGMVVIAADAEDNIGIDHVEFYVNNTLLENGYDSTTPFQTEWNTSTCEDSAEYTVYVKAYDTSLNYSLSDTVHVIVDNSSPPTADKEPPTVIIITPGDGEFVSGTTTIISEATDNIAVQEVEFYIDGLSPEGSTEYNAPYEYRWDTEDLDDGSVHTIAAKATDTSGNVKYSEIVHVTIDNLTPPPPDTESPSVFVSAPENGAEVSGTITIHAIASDNAAVEKVEFFLDGVLLSNGIDYAAPYEYELNTTLFANGSAHAIMARAVDTSGNEANSSMIQISIQNSIPDIVPPTVSLLTPGDGTVVSGTVHIIADASDDEGVDHVDFLIDGMFQPGGSEYSPPYEYFWNTTGLDDGSIHTICARAVDESGNEASSAIASVTVDNSSGTSYGVILNEDLTSRQVFPANNWWNLDVSNAPLDSNSSGFINFIGWSRSLHADFGGSPYGIPYVTVPGDQPLKTVYFYSYGGESDDGAPGRPDGYPIPDEAYLTAGYIEGGRAGGGDSGDRHLLVIDRDNWLLFELFGTHWDASEQRWEAASGAVFNLGTNDRRPEGWTSTDAAGLAVFPGLIRYDEVYGPGEIEHALRFTVRASNGYVWPASHAAGSTSGAPPMGMRMRLKSSVNISGYAAPVQKILRAMKKYGLIVADNGSDMYIQGTMDDRWDIGLINGVFHSLTAGDFEVIELGWDPVNN